jgi:hypothetical protein
MNCPDVGPGAKVSDGSAANASRVCASSVEARVRENAKLNAMDQHLITCSSSRPS